MLALFNFVVVLPEDEVRTISQALMGWQFQIGIEEYLCPVEVVTWGTQNCRAWVNNEYCHSACHGAGCALLKSCKAHLNWGREQ